MSPELSGEDLKNICSAEAGTVILPDSLVIGFGDVSSHWGLSEISILRH